MENALKPQKTSPNRLIQIKYRRNNLENRFSILSVKINLMIATKISPLLKPQVIEIHEKCFKTTENAPKSPNSDKIPREKC